MFLCTVDTYLTKRVDNNLNFLKKCIRIKVILYKWIRIVAEKIYTWFKCRKMIFINYRNLILKTLGTKVPTYNKNKPTNTYYIG